MTPYSRKTWLHAVTRDMMRCAIPSTDILCSVPLFKLNPRVFHYKRYKKDDKLRRYEH